MLYVLRLILCIVLFTSQGTSLAQGVEEDNVSLIMEKARSNAEEMNLPVNKYEVEGLRAAEETSKLFHSPEFQERIQCEQQRLEKEVFGEYIAPWKKKTQQAVKEQTEQTGSLSPMEKVILFISSSVPDETVHAYIAGIDKTADLNVSLVMRGFVGGMSQAKTKDGPSYFSRILKKDLGCRKAKKPCQRYEVAIRLKPSLFTKYGITQVPAVVYEHEKDAYLIQGDTGFDYLLEMINREVKSTGLTDLIKKIRGGL